MLCSVCGEQWLWGSRTKWGNHHTCASGHIHVVSRTAEPAPGHGPGPWPDSARGCRPRPADVCCILQELHRDLCRLKRLNRGDPGPQWWGMYLACMPCTGCTRVMSEKIRARDTHLYHLGMIVRWKQFQLAETADTRCAPQDIHDWR